MAKESSRTIGAVVTLGIVAILTFLLTFFSDPELRFWSAIISLFTGGAAILLAFEREGLWAALFKDVGMALLIAAVVTVLYEKYARREYDRKTIESTLNIVMGDLVEPGIWTQVRAQILERDSIRKNVDIRVKLNRIPGSSYQMELSMETDYDVYALRSNQKFVRIIHLLDKHIRNEGLRLPRFDHVLIGSKRLSQTELARINERQLIDTEAPIDPKGGNPLHVEIQRRELVYLPGSWNYYFLELTKAVRFHLDEKPDGVIFMLDYVPFDLNGKTLNSGDFETFEDKVFLPGQGLAFRFLKMPAQ